MQPSFERSVKRFVGHFEQALSCASQEIVDSALLRKACAHALAGGKRLRPCIVLMVGDALQSERNLLSAALCSEYLHTASLIADDLPCMDDAAMRRGRPALHKAYGEATALLASYALIAAAYRELAQSSALVPLSKRGEVTSLALATVAEASSQASAGQECDLSKGIESEEAMLRAIEYKTGSLFCVPFALGWLFGGGDPKALGEVRELANSLGRAYQLSDDLADREEDRELAEGRNASLVLGERRTRALLDKSLCTCKALLKRLSLDSDPLKHLLELLAGETDAPLLGTSPK